MPYDIQGRSGPLENIVAPRLIVALLLIFSLLPLASSPFRRASGSKPLVVRLKRIKILVRIRLPHIFIQVESFWVAFFKKRQIAFHRILASLRSRNYLKLPTTASRRSRKLGNNTIKTRRATRITAVHIRALHSEFPFRSNFT